MTTKLEQAARALLAKWDAHPYTPWREVGFISGDVANLREALAEKSTVSDGVCGGCAKKAADGWALYCVECWEKAEQEHIANADKMVTTLKITLPKQGKCKCGDKRFPVFSGNREYCETCGWPIISCEHQRKPDHCGDATEKVGQDCGGAQHHRYAGNFGE